MCDAELVTIDFLGPDQDYGCDVVAGRPDGKILLVGYDCTWTRNAAAGLFDLMTEEQAESRSKMAS